MDKVAKHTSGEAELLQTWQRRCREAQFAHYQEAERLGKLNIWLGIPVIALTALVSTSVFASLADDGQQDPQLQLLTGFLSVLAAVLASLQTFMKFSERAEQHRSVGARYGSTKRQLETLTVLSARQQASNTQFEQIQQELDSISAEAPGIPRRTFSQVHKVLNQLDQQRTT